jgi:hypothetical protein
MRSPLELLHLAAKSRPGLGRADDDVTLEAPGLIDVERRG